MRLPNRELEERHGLSRSVIFKLRREYGISAPGRQPKRWTEQAIARLGKESDSALARALGIGPSAVLLKRRSLGIPRWNRARRWTKAECRWLGALTDEEIAHRLGLTTATVGAKRRSLGIGRAPRARTRR